MTMNQTWREDMQHAALPLPSAERLSLSGVLFFF